MAVEHKTSLILTALITLAVGIVLGVQIAPQEKSVKEVQIPAQRECPPVKVDARNPEQLCQNDQSKDYYEQAVALFIAAIGVNLNERQASELKRLGQDPKNYTPPADLEVVPGPARQREDGPKVIAPENTTLYLSRQQVTKDLNQKGASLDDFYDRELLAATLKKVVKRPTLFYARSINSEEMKVLKRINGTFRGSLYHLAGKNKGETDQIVLSADFRLKGKNEVDGEFQLLLSRAGETYSDSRGSGGNGNVRTLGDEILIKAGPESFFHFVDSRLSMANFYTSGQFIGVARFIKD